jgi:hypothetical protein
MKYLFLINLIKSLSYFCDYDIFGEKRFSNFLYKEEELPVMKWLGKVEYCRAKGDPNIYADAGKDKCEYSRGLCYWDNGSCLNTYRASDTYKDCMEVWLNNELVDGLDNGRLNMTFVEPFIRQEDIEAQVQVEEPVTLTENLCSEIPPYTDAVIDTPIQLHPEKCHYMYILIV